MQFMKWALAFLVLSKTNQDLVIPMNQALSIPVGLGKTLLYPRRIGWAETSPPSEEAWGGYTIGSDIPLIFW